MGVYLSVTLIMHLLMIRIFVTNFGDLEIVAPARPTFSLPVVYVLNS